MDTPLKGAAGTISLVNTKWEPEGKGKWEAGRSNANVLGKGSTKVGGGEGRSNTKWTDCCCSVPLFFSGFRLYYYL